MNKLRTFSTIFRNRNNSFYETFLVHLIANELIINTEFNFCLQLLWFSYSRLPLKLTLLIRKKVLTLGEPVNFKGTPHI